MSHFMSHLALGRGKHVEVVLGIGLSDQNMFDPRSAKSLILLHSDPTDCSMSLKYKGFCFTRLKGEDARVIGMELIRTLETYEG